MATAVYIKSESCDTYLYCFSQELTEQEAKMEAMRECPEHPDHWAEFKVEYSK